MGFVQFQEGALPRAMIVMSGSALRVRSPTPGNAKGTGVVMAQTLGQWGLQNVMDLFAQLALAIYDVETAPKA